MIFVVAFSRANGKLVEYRKFNDAERAQAESLYRLRLTNAMFQESDDVEVNMFEAADEGVFRKTHSRYFRTQAQVMQDIIEQLQSTLPK